MDVPLWMQDSKDLLDAYLCWTERELGKKGADVRFECPQLRPSWGDESDFDFENNVILLKEGEDWDLARHGLALMRNQVTRQVLDPDAPFVAHQAKQELEATLSIYFFGNLGREVFKKFSESNGVRVDGVSDEREQMWKEDARLVQSLHEEYVRVDHSLSNAFQWFFVPDYAFFSQFAQALTGFAHPFGSYAPVLKELDAVVAEPAKYRHSTVSFARQEKADLEAGRFKAAFKRAVPFFREWESRLDERRLDKRYHECVERTTPVYGDIEKLYQMVEYVFPSGSGLFGEKLDPQVRDLACYYISGVAVACGDGRLSTDLLLKTDERVRKEHIDPLCDKVRRIRNTYDCYQDIAKARQKAVQTQKACEAVLDSGCFFC